jgi:predicted kinase
MNAENKNAIVLIRGLPGSGKSTLGNLLSENGKYPVLSVDHYFTDKHGKYSFEYQKNHLAYDQCKQNVLSEIKKKAQKIFVDNTFTLDWEMEPYFKLASENNYKIFVITVENYHGGKNIHEISDEQINKMALKYKVKLL